MCLNSPLRYLAIALIAFSLSYFGWQTAAKLRSQPQAIGSNLVSLPGNYYSVKIPSPAKNPYLSAEYRVWIPARIERVRGLLVKQHGCGDNAASYGLDYANDLQWQALASKHQFALMGTRFLVGDEPCDSWSYLSHGSGDTFLQALDTVAKQSQRDEFNSVPWILWGHSGGADWAAQMLQEYPQRTIAMVAVRGGGQVFFGVNQQLAEIPVMFSLGEHDTKARYPIRRIELPQTIFGRYRKLDALWSLAIEANAGHEAANSRWLVIPYLDALIDMRLAQDSNELIAIDRSQGWLGNIDTHEIASVDRYQGVPFEAVWLPNEEVARKWQEYVTVGKVSPTRKPKAPTEVRITEAEPKEAIITWNYTPDLENGLPSFRIYRNNSLVQTLEGQSPGSGDNPKPAQIALEFIDRQAKANSVYQVAAFNELGESISLPISYGTKNN